MPRFLTAANIHEPGDVIEVDDGEIAGIFHHLEGLDDDSRELVERARAKLKEPAKRIWVGDLDRMNAARFQLGIDDNKRRHGRTEELLEEMAKRRQAAMKMAKVRRGGDKGRREGHETKRDSAARGNEALLAAVKEHRKKHPGHGRPAIAEKLLGAHGRRVDDFKPEDRTTSLRPRVDGKASLKS